MVLVDDMSDIYAKRVERLRVVLKKHKEDGCIIYWTDKYMSEYPRPEDSPLGYISGFFGSGSFAIITIQRKILVTNGIYLAQAKQDLDDSWEIYLYKDFKDDFMKKLSDLHLCYDGMVTPFREHDNRMYNKAIVGCGTTIKCREEQFVSLLMDEDKIKEKKKKKDELSIINPSKVENMDISFSGESVLDKVKRVLNEVDEKARYMLITSPTSVCWLLNIRGNDLEHVPVCLSYLLLDCDSDDHYLFTEESNIAELSKLETGIKLKVRDISSIKNFIKKMTSGEEGRVIQFDHLDAPRWFYDRVDEKRRVLKTNPCTLMKACKNDVEIDGFKKANVSDSVAIVKMFHWLYNTYKSGVDEYDITEKIVEIRKQDASFLKNSFATISSFGGKPIHYRVSKESASKIDDSNLFLCDTGGHYNCGTTDTTRTIHLGEPKREHIRHFTLVLKGMIKLSMAVFPEGTTGLELDILARQDLAKNGKNYPHGTGHGIGHVLSVHEGPHAINNSNMVPLKEGMIVTNEPGYYVEGDYSIRIENAMVVRRHRDSEILYFETLPFVPIDRKLVDNDMLSEDEQQWLEKYHREVYYEISPHLSTEEREWLHKACLE